MMLTVLLLVTLLSLVFFAQYACFHFGLQQQRTRSLTSRRKNIIMVGTRGLLSGIADVKNARFYSDNLVIKDSRDLLEDGQFVYNVLLKKYQDRGNLEKNLTDTMANAK